MTMLCPSCRAENADEARFCNQCGSELDGAAAAPEAERRQITVFFSDLSGYTALTDQYDAEDVRSIMNRIFGQATEIVERYGGRIEKLLGDAVMAVFGDPVAHEDDAERAVRAVLELHAAVAALSPEVEPVIGRPIMMHSGINTGVVITSGAEFDNAVGDAINVAARLEALSESGEILVGPETASLVAGVFDAVDHGAHELKGKSGPVEVTRIRGLAAERVEPSRKRATFVGRHEELGVLLGAVERMRDGETSVVTVEAEAGTGKTRLLSEFRQRLPGGVQWLEGRAYNYGENVPFAAVIDLLGRAIGVNEDDVTEVVEEKLRGAVAEYADDSDDVYGPLARLFGLPVPEKVALDRETYQRRLRDAVVVMAEALAGRAPTVVAFQDLHWADPSTVRLIRDLIDRLRSPVVVVGNYRPPFSLDIAGARALHLAELSPRQTAELLTSLLDDGDPPQGLVEFIVERTDGNPFYIEEIVNSLVETGALLERGDRWELAGDLAGINLPTSIRGVIAARIDRLDEGRRRVLREASVVGREFLYDVVRRVTTTGGNLMRSLTALESADLIRQKAPDPDLEYFFKHALTQDVAYDGLLKTEREQLHERAAVAIEAQFAGRIEEVTETLAYHWVHSGVVEKAVVYLIAAGRKAMERFALEESQAHFSQAYALLENEPDSETRDRAIVQVLLEWASLAYYQARLYDLRELMMDNQGSVDRVGTAEEQGMWMAWIGHGHMAADGAYRKAIETLDAALEIGTKSGSARVVAYTQAWRVYVLWWLGRNEEAIAAAEAGLSLCGHMLDEPYVWFKAKCGLGMVLASMGEYGEATRIAEELVEFGERTGSARSKAMGHLVHVNVANLLNDEPGSQTHIRAITDSGNDPIYEHAPVPHLFTLILAGKADEARRYHDDHYQRFVVGLHVRLVAEFLEMADGLLKVLEGKLTEGFAQMEAVEAKAVRSGERVHEQYARTMLALAYTRVAMADAGLATKLRNVRFAVGRGLRSGREAHERMEDLLAHLSEWGRDGLRFSVEVTYAELLAHEGDSDRAAAHLESAVAAIENAGETPSLLAARARLESLRR